MKAMHWRCQTIISQNQIDGGNRNLCAQQLTPLSESRGTVQLEIGA
jgi:hypothetical protein